MSNKNWDILGAAFIVSSIIGLIMLVTYIDKLDAQGRRDFGCGVQAFWGIHNPDCK